MNVDGYLPHRIIKAMVFWVLTGCLLAATVAGLLWTWELIGAEAARRVLWSIFILSSSSLVFLLMNLAFGQLEMSLIGARNPGPPMDPAFADRLKKAKELRSGEDSAGKKAV